MDFLQKRAEQAEEAEDLETACELWKQLAAKEREPFFFFATDELPKSWRSGKMQRVHFPRPSR